MPLGNPPSAEHELPLPPDPLPPLPVPASRWVDEPPLPELEPALPPEPPAAFDPPLALEPPVPVEPPLPVEPPPVVLEDPGLLDEPLLSNEPLLPVVVTSFDPKSPLPVVETCDPAESGMSSPAAHPANSSQAVAPHISGTNGKRRVNFTTSNLVRCRSTTHNARGRRIDHRAVESMRSDSGSAATNLSA
jgi:hypothetical protein